MMLAMFFLPVSSSKYFNDRNGLLWRSVVNDEKPLMRNSCLMMIVKIKKKKDSCRQRKVEGSDCRHERCPTIPGNSFRDLILTPE